MTEQPTGATRGATGARPGPTAEGLGEQLARLGAQLGAREAAHREELARAETRARELHSAVAAALDRFHDSVTAAGAPHLRIELGAPRLDQKHIRSVEFSLNRGRWTGIVTVKSRGEVTLVGPFRQGKTEGPCRSFPSDADAEIRAALGAFLERFVEEATSP